MNTPCALADEEKRNRYLYGDCAKLALAVHAITGWMPAKLHDREHMMVIIPDGRLADASGIHDQYREEDYRVWNPRHHLKCKGSAEVFEAALQPDVLADAYELACGIREYLAETKKEAS